jgi:hypothetical protein
MSTQRDRSLSGPVTVVSTSPSFADRIIAAGITLPDQALMVRMMRATRVELPWNATEEQVVAAEMRTPNKLPFVVFSLEQYLEQPDNRYGSPMPWRVRLHIWRLLRKFPKAEICIHAHPIEDPVVEAIDDGQRLFTKAWKRAHGTLWAPVYP